MFSEPRLGLEVAGSSARCHVALMSSASTGWPFTGDVFENLASGRSLIVQVIASGDSALRPTSGSTSWLVMTAGSSPVLNLNTRLSTPPTIVCAPADTFCGSSGGLYWTTAVNVPPALGACCDCEPDWLPLPEPLWVDVALV